MEIYIDKDFMRHIFTVKSVEKEILDDFEDWFFKKIRNFKLVTNYESQEEMAACEYGSFFLELYADKVKRIQFSGNIKDQWIETGLLTGGYKIFLVEIEDQLIAALIDRSGYEFISTKNVEIIWKKYISKEIKKSIDSQPNPKDTYIFNGWGDLEIIRDSPTHSIILADKYILSDKQDQKLDDNIIPILDNLISLISSKSLDLIIISEEIISNDRITPLKEKVVKVHEKITKYFSKYKLIELRVKILLHNKLFYPNENMEIHDRIIYTNYFTIKCGKGFNLFKGKRRIRANSEVEINFNYQPYYMSVLPRHLDSLKEYIEKVKRIEVRDDQFKYYPDLDCKLLK